MCMENFYAKQYKIYKSISREFWTRYVDDIDGSILI